MKADLHVHSVYSDGKLNVQQIIDYAKARGLQTIAITDHDSVSAYQDIIGVNTDIKVIIGSEISALSKGEEIHILGYFYENKVPEAIKIFLADKQLKRHARIKEIITKLKEYYDLELTYEEIVIYADGVIGRPHIAMAIEKKHGISRDEIFERYLGNDSPAYVPADQLEVAEAIKILKENNALVVLAHPKYLKKNNIEDIIELGIDGIEINYPGQEEDFKIRLKKIAKKNHLVITGGSDYHGPESTADMGEYYISGSNLELFITRISNRQQKR